MNVVILPATDGSDEPLPTWIGTYLTLGLVISVVSFTILCVWASISYLNTRERDEARRQAGAAKARTDADDWQDCAFFAVAVGATAWLFWGPALFAFIIYWLTKTVVVGKRAEADRAAVERYLDEHPEVRP